MTAMFRNESMITWKFYASFVFGGSSRDFRGKCIFLRYFSGGMSRLSIFSRAPTLASVGGYCWLGSR